MKQKEIKLLVVSDTAFLNEKKVIEGLNRFCRRKFDAVICIGENTPVVIREAECLYPKTLKLCVYGDKTSSRPYREYGFQDINQKLCFHADTSYYGYASHKFNSKGPSKDMFKEMSKADIFISSNNPDGVNMNDEYESKDVYPELNKYNDIQKPLCHFHAGQHIRLLTKTNGVSVRSCYGVLAITITKEGIPLAEQKKIRAQKRRDEKLKSSNKIRIPIHVNYENRIML